MNASCRHPTVVGILGLEYAIAKHLEAEIESLGSMLILLNTFAECQTDTVNSLPLFIHADMSLSFTLSRLPFGPCYLFLGLDF